MTEGALTPGRVAAATEYAVYEYLGHARAPDDDILGAGRATTAARLGGLTAAAAGRRRVGAKLLAAGSAAGLAQVAVRIRRRDGDDGTRR